jgi:uncharacterized protein
MLKLDLAKLERERSLRIQAEIPEDDALWSGSGLRFTAAVEVDLDASVTASGEYVVRGTLKGLAGHECRRCLKPVSTPIEVPIILVFAASDTLGGTDDGDIRAVGPTETELDLGEPVREELILSVAPYAVCSPDCKGLCPRCGADLNVETCQCATEELDPRWDALRALKTD